MISEPSELGTSQHPPRPPKALCRVQTTCLPDCLEMGASPSDVGAPRSLRTLVRGDPPNTPKHPRTGRTMLLWPCLPKPFLFGFTFHCILLILKQIETRAASGPSALLGPKMVKFASNFCYCAVDQEKAVFQWKRVVSGSSALLGLEMVKFASNFSYCAVDQEKAVFQWKRAVSGSSAFLGPEMVKFASNFCYCAVNQEKAVFRWKRAVSGPSALLGPEMINLLRILLLCCRPRKGRFSMETGRFWPICPFGARNGQIRFEFLLLCCSPRKGRFSMETRRFLPICPFGARNGQICFSPRKGRFSMETRRFLPICPFGARNGQICFEFLLLRGRPRKGRFFNGNGPFLAHLPFWGPKWSNLLRISAIVL